MDLQSIKTTHESSVAQSFDTESNKSRDDIATRINTHKNNDGEYSGRRSNQVQDSLDNIIKKYKDEQLKMKYKFSNQNLNQKMGEHALFNDNAEYMRSVHNFYNYRQPNYLTGSICGSATDINVTKPNCLLKENKKPKVNLIQPNSNHEHIYKQTVLTSREKINADKATYCRPVTSLYNQDFIYKTMERNSRLKRLLKKLTIARQREKENVNWNNFINELKNKHCSSSNDTQRIHVPQHKQYITPDIIDDYYNIRFPCQKSTPCRHLLHDFYEGYIDAYQSAYYTDRRPQGSKPHVYLNHYSLPYYHTNSCCYPTASQGRLLMLEREKQRSEYLNQWHKRLSNNHYTCENNQEEKNLGERIFVENQMSKNIKSLKTFIDSAATQTDHYRRGNILYKSIATNKTENLLRDEVIQTFEIDKKYEDKNPGSIGSNMKTISLVRIENKLETLINCINDFIDEIKINRKSKRNTRTTSEACELSNIANKKIITTETNSASKLETTRTDQLLCSERFNDSSESTIKNPNFAPRAMPKSAQVDEIMKEIDKLCSQDRLFKNHPGSVNIKFELPTRDCSTEVTKSLSKQHAGDKDETIEEISTPEQLMTIAVNTDPLNFLSLIRTSTNALIRLLSNVPNINYHSYLALLPFQQMPRKVESHFICNICGTAFNKPSALSDHVQEHNLGNTRDCSVCRHVIDMRRRQLSLFKCKFCGQRFTRAYCCELHQRRCGQLLGRAHDVASSLVLLR